MVLLEAVGGAAVGGAGPDDVGGVVAVLVEGGRGGFGGFDGEDAGEFVVGDGDGGFGGEEGGLVGVGEEEDGFGYVVDFVRRRGRGGLW